MAFQGDLSSFPLPELLQWLDSSRKSGVLQLQADGSERRLFVTTGQVSAVSSPGLYDRIARVLELGKLGDSRAVLGALHALRGQASSTEAPFRDLGLDPQLAIELSREELHAVIADLTQTGGGHFHWADSGDPSGEEWTSVDLSTRHLVFEALRWSTRPPRSIGCCPRIPSPCVPRLCPSPRCR